MNSHQIKEFAYRSQNGVSSSTNSIGSPTACVDEESYRYVAAAPDRPAVQRLDGWASNRSPCRHRLPTLSALITSGQLAMTTRRRRQSLFVRILFLAQRGGHCRRRGLCLCTPPYKWSCGLHSDSILKPGNITEIEMSLLEKEKTKDARWMLFIIDSDCNC